MLLTPLPVTTPRTRLRRLTPADLRDFQSYRTDPEVGRYQGWTTSGDLAASLFLEQNATTALFVPGEWFQLGIAWAGNDGDADRLIGDIGIGIDEHDPRRAEIGFSLSAAWQGRGLAAEAVAAARRFAVEEGGVRRFAAITDARNAASIRLLERLGFALESTQDALFRGAPCREHHYRWDAADTGAGA